MQCACATLSSVAYPILQYLSTLSHKRDDFRKTFLSTKHVISFPLTLLSATFLILSRTERDIKNEYESSRKVPAILIRF
jgi:hypothetical protein